LIIGYRLSAFDSVFFVFVFFFFRLFDGLIPGQCLILATGVDSVPANHEIENTPDTPG
jgi:hypothetical protein